MVRLLRLWPAVSHRVVSFSFYGIVIFVFFLYQVSTTLSGFSLTLNIHLFRLFSSWHHSIWTSRDSHRLLVPTGCSRYFNPPKSLGCCKWRRQGLLVDGKKELRKNQYAIRVYHVWPPYLSLQRFWEST